MMSSRTHHATPAIWIDSSEQHQVLGHHERPCSLSSSISMEDLSSLPSLNTTLQSPSCSPTNSNSRSSYDTMSPTNMHSIPMHICATADDPIAHFQACRSISDAATILRPVTRRYKQQRIEIPEVTLVNEIELKYNTEQGLGCADPEGPSLFMKPMSSPVKASGCLPGKRGQSGYLELLVLNHRQIVTAGDLGQLRSMVCHITELDLAHNCLSDWAEVSLILSHMPLLRHCNLSSNPLYGTAPLDWHLSSGQLEMLHLDSLVLNDTGVRWDVLCMLLRMLPRLHELHLSKHNYAEKSSLPSPHLYNQGFHSIAHLHLNNCNIGSWQTLCRLCAPFPSLQSLVAADNPLRELGMKGDHHNNSFSTARVLSRLHTLNVNRCLVQNWDEVDRLNALPALTELRLIYSPFLQPHEELEQWHFLVARLPSIQVLNGSHVTDDHRIDAERFFLRAHLDDSDKPERYFELERIHGPIMPLADVNLRPKNQVSVTVVCEDIGYSGDHVIDVQQNVGQLKKLMASIVNIPPAKMKLFHDELEFGFSAELKYASIMVHTLRIEDGHRLIVQRKPEPRRANVIPVRRTSGKTSAGTSPMKTSK